MFDINTVGPVAHRAAQEFIGTKATLTRLGYGVTGCVYASPAARTAVKVHHRQVSYDVERRAYERLRAKALTQLLGLSIPIYQRSEPKLFIIEMTTVGPPYLLDFAGVAFKKPDFSSDTVRDAFATNEMRFGKNAHLVYDVQSAFLAATGMWYQDMRPGNLNFDRHPDADADPHSDDDGSEPY